jgi:hypothetical protein
VEDAALDLHGKYANYLVAKVQQATYLDGDNLGVCCAFCIDWISRRQNLLRAKASLAASKKDPTAWPLPNALVKSAGLPAALDPNRMQRKIDRRINPAQQRYLNGSNKTSLGALAAFKSMPDPKGHFTGMCGREVTTGPKFIVNRASDAQPREGERVFRELLGYCQPPKQSTLVEKFRAELAQAERDRPYLVPMYKKALNEAQKEAQKDPNNHPRGGVDPAALSYVVSLLGADIGGHAIALYIDQFRWTFFDPNYGEFEFPLGSKATMYEFCNDLWFNYRARREVGKRMYQWRLVEFYFPK